MNWVLWECVAGVSCRNARVWIGVFEGNGGDNGEGAVRFSPMRAGAVYRAMLQRIQKTYCMSSQAVQVSRRPGHPPGVERRIPRLQIFGRHDCCALASS